MLGLQFHGATDCVTGSRCLFTTPQARVLVDDGLFQGGQELKARNWEPPQLPPLDAVVLTHAHLDHTGDVPRLVRDGYRGPVYCTHGTADLLGLLWPDSAYLQQEEARHARRHGYSRHAAPAPLYTALDAQRAQRQLRTLAYAEPREVAPGVQLSYAPVGHILGAARAGFEVAGMTVVFSGDVGRRQGVLMKAPAPLKRADVLVLESTYGDRDHPAGDPTEALGQVVREAAARRGMLLIPAFAVGRTQEVLVMLRRLEDQGAIPSLEVFVDSPMAIDATDLLEAHAEDLNEDARERLERGTLFPRRTHYVRDVERSKAINSFAGPGIIISASGMATGGRIKHHLHQRLGDPRATVCLVGFQAAGTRGRALQEGASHVWLFGDHLPVRAHVTEVPGLSAHADRGELLAWLRGLREAPRQTFLVHGEPEGREGLAELIRAELGWQVVLPRRGETYTLARSHSVAATEAGRRLHP